MKQYKYDECKKLIKDKDIAVQFYIDNYSDKCKSMFEYSDLPDSIPQQVLEEYLQENGNCIFTKVEDVLYIFTGGLGGELDEYYRPTIYTVANPALKLSKDFKIDEDCILVKNDSRMMGILPLIKKYAVLLTDSELTLNTAAIFSRITMLISASDDKTKASAELFLQKIQNGEYSVVGENAFLDGVKVQSATNGNNTQYLTQLVELIQYYKATFLNELGLNANYNMKRERLTTSEVAMNVDVLLPFADNMLAERKEGIEKVNAMFGTNISVDFSSAWKTTHEHEEQETELAELSIASQLENSGTVSQQGEEIEETEETETETETEETETETETDETIEPEPENKEDSAEEKEGDKE